MCTHKYTLLVLMYRRSLVWCWEEESKKRYWQVDQHNNHHHYHKLCNHSNQNKNHISEDQNNNNNNNNNNHMCSLHSNRSIPPSPPSLLPPGYKHVISTQLQKLTSHYFSVIVREGNCNNHNGVIALGLMLLPGRTEGVQIYAPSYTHIHLLNHAPSSTRVHLVKHPLSCYILSLVTSSLRLPIFTSMVSYTVYSY